MDAIPYTRLRGNLAKEMDRVCDDHATIIVTRKSSRSVVMISLDDYEALVLPGGVINPDKLRRSKESVAFAQQFLEAGKPVAAICHGPQLLIETGLLKERELTSYPSVKTDLQNAGATWHDKEVIVDNGLVTSRSPEDLKAFNKKMIEEIAEGVHVHVPAH